ncbi:hypothetical protein KXR87_22685 [Yokenella regensburgei]|uniref:hypothetical protein n=1 Tax=Yokenella regensburgei TaxID=158877 RepID=UPI003F13C648
MKPFVHSVSDLVTNIRTYCREMAIHSDSPIFDQVGRVKCWYAWREPETTEWLFAPSKYIGYAGMDKDYYAENYRDLDGKITEVKLSKFSAGVSKSDHAMLEKKLAERLFYIHRSPGKSIKIRVVNDPDNEVHIPGSQQRPVFILPSTDLDFYRLVQEPRLAPKVTSIAYSEESVKLDLSFNDDRYSVALQRQSNGKFVGHAERHDNVRIPVEAYVHLSDDDLEIEGTKWVENGSDYAWHLSVDRKLL